VAPEGDGARPSRAREIAPEDARRTARRSRERVGGGRAPRDVPVGFASRRQNAISRVAIGLAIAAAVAVAHAGSLDGGFVLDARAQVLLNPAVHAATWANVATLVSHDYWYPFGAGGLYRPATTISYLVSYAVLGSGDRPLGYHVASLLLHLACTYALYALVLRVQGVRWTAAVAAALFGLHPLATEAVSSIAGRADLLAALGVLTALAIHAAGRGRGLESTAFALAAALAFFAKETGLVLPVLLIAHDRLLGARPGARWRYAIAAALLVVYVAARLHAASADVPVEDTPALDNPLVEVDALRARLTAVAVAGRELALFVWPARLSADYSCCEIPVVGWPPSGRDAVRVGLSALALGAVALWIARQRGTRPGRCFFAVLAVVAWLPASNLVAIIGTILAERTLYLPLAGVAAVVADVVQEVRARGTPARARAITAACVAVLVACGARTWARARDWRSDRRLWESALAAVPGSAKANASLAATLFVERGGAADLDTVIALGERAVAIRPDYQNALVALGGHYVVKGDELAERSGAADASPWYERSVAVLERARALDAAAVERFRRSMAARGVAPDAIPDRADANLYNNLSLAYVRTGRLPEALAAYERSRDLDPLNARRHSDVAAVLAQLGRWQDATVEMFEAVLLAPGDAELRSWLVELLRRSAPGSVATLAPDRVEVDAGHPDVRRHRCAALEALVRDARAAGDAERTASFERARDESCGGRPAA